MADLRLEELVRGFLLDRRAKGLSARTLEWYGQKLKAFLAYCEAADGPTMASEVQREHVTAFLGGLHDKTQGQDAVERLLAREGILNRAITGHTVHGYLRTLKAFFSWALEEGYIEHHPLQRVRYKLPKKVIPTFAPSQIHAFLKAIERHSRCPVRDRAIVLLLLDTGMRASELLNLRLDDVLPEDGYLKVVGKGNKERLVPLGATGQRALWAYVHGERPEPYLPHVRNVFLSREARPLKLRSLEQVVKVLGTHAGIEGVRLSPHTFRHTFAVSYLRNGGDVFTLQEILGHTSLEVVKVYVALVQRDWKAAHEKASPVDRLELELPRGTRGRGKVFRGALRAEHEKLENWES